jgi:hypothetical protein
LILPVRILDDCQKGPEALDAVRDEQGAIRKSLKLAACEEGAITTYCVSINHEIQFVEI